MEDISDFKLLAETEQLLMEAPEGKVSAEDFAALEDKFFVAADNKYYHHFSFEKWYPTRYHDLDNILEDSVIDLMSADACSYPEKFLQHDHRKLQAPLVHGLILCIISGQKQAEALAEALFIEPIDYEMASCAMACGILSRNLDFLNNLLDMYEIKAHFYDCFCMDMYARASDMGIADLFDDMLKNASYEDIKKLIKDWSMLGVYPFSTEDNRINKYEIEYIYELVSKTPRAWDGRSVSDTVNELIWDCGIHSSFSYDFFSDDSSEDATEHLARAWDFMKEHGLSFRDLGHLPTINNKSSSKAQDKLLFLKEHLFPVLDEKLYITVNDYSIGDRRLIMDIIDDIGSSRVALDCTTRRNSFHSITLRPSIISPLIRKGVKVVLDENIRNSCFIYELLNCGISLLEVMLNKDVFSDEQLGVITDICIERKCLDALNVIRKNLSQRKGEK